MKFKDYGKDIHVDDLFLLTETTDGIVVTYVDRSPLCTRYILNQWVQDNTFIVFVDTDIVQTFDIKVVPQIRFFHNGNVIDKLIGTAPEEEFYEAYERFIEPTLGERQLLPFVYSGVKHGDLDINLLSSKVRSSPYEKLLKSTKLQEITDGAVAYYTRTEENESYLDQVWVRNILAAGYEVNSILHKKLNLKSDFEVHLYREGQVQKKIHFRLNQDQFLTELNAINVGGLYVAK